MNNLDALNAIVDIKEAIAEYGSTIKIITNEQTDYDPYEGATVSRTEIPTKGIIKRSSTNEALNKSVDNYELSIMFYSSNEITTDNLINYKDNDYEIVPNGLAEKILQDTTLIYEALVKRNKIST